jgi:hypothetical protein
MLLTCIYVAASSYERRLWALSSSHLLQHSYRHASFCISLLYLLSRNLGISFLPSSGNYGFQDTDRSGSQRVSSGAASPTHPTHTAFSSSVNPAPTVPQPTPPLSTVPSLHTQIYAIDSSPHSSSLLFSALINLCLQSPRTIHHTRSHEEGS